MDAKVLDGCDFATELVREARVDAAEDRFLTNRANMDMADRVISIVALVFGACACVPCSRTCCLSSDRRLQRLYTWNHHKGNHHKGACHLCGGFCF